MIIFSHFFFYVCSYGYQVVCTTGNPSSNPFPLITYCGKDPMKHFIRNLKQTAFELNMRLKTNVPLQWTAETRKLHAEATECFMCGLG